jgi:AraC family transcriptional regulator
MKPWLSVHKALGTLPFMEGQTGGRTPLYAERYLMSGIDRDGPALDWIALLTQFDGARVQEGETGKWRLHTLPSQSIVLPRNCTTHWHYNGVVDFAIFYLPEIETGLSGYFERLMRNERNPLQFSDGLVSASALQIMTELYKGKASDLDYVDQLVEVMLKQAYRCLTVPQSDRFSPRHVHFDRLQKVLPYIRNNLSNDLSAGTLADIAGVSIAHFRRLFVDAMGVPPNEYVQRARLELARTLMRSTNLPISRVADECGYSSQSHFTAAFKAAHASTPGEYRALLLKAPVSSRLPTA